MVKIWKNCPSARLGECFSLSVLCRPWSSFKIALWKYIEFSYFGKVFQGPNPTTWIFFEQRYIKTWYFPSHYSFTPPRKIFSYYSIWLDNYYWDFKKVFRTSKTWSQWRLRSLRSEPTRRFREDVSKVVKICSGKFQWLLLILILPKNKLLHKYQILIDY